MVIVCLCPYAGAQIGAVGQIRGEVRDQTGAVITGAEVRARNLDTGVTRTGVSNDSGYYLFPGIDPRVYEVQCSKAGCRTAIRPRIVAQTQQISSVDFTLTVGQAREVVTVDAREGLLKTEDANLSVVVGEKRLEEIPLPTRYVAQLTALEAGVAPLRTPQNRFEGSGFLQSHLPGN